MKKIGVIVGCLALLAGMVQATPGITGCVTDSLGSPILGALVTVFENPYGSPDSSAAYTDSTGIYIIYLSPGNYYAHCYKEGYIPEWWDDALLPRDADPIFVDSVGGITSGIDFVLSEDNLRYGYIEGMVTDQDTEEGIGYVRVSFFFQGSPYPIASTFSGVDGYYIKQLPVNEIGFLVRAEKSGYEVEWYPESSIPDSAQPVPVEEGETTSDIDFTLSTSTEPSSISGYVIRSDSLFLEATLSLYTDYWGVPVETTVTNYGFYTFQNIEPGCYFVFCDAGNYGEMWWDGESNPEDADSVCVCGEAITGINFYFGNQTEDRTIAGWVVDEETEMGIGGAWVVVYADPSGDSIAGYTDYSGRYVISGVPAGSLYAMANARGYLSEWYYESEDFEGATPFAVPEGEILDNIDFTLTQDTLWMPGSISGQVTTAEGVPIVDAWVTALVGDFAGGTSRVDSTGYYTIERLIPGSYYVVASAPGFCDEWYEESPNPQGATLVEVNAGEEHTGIDFTLDPMEVGCITGKVMDTDSVGIPRAFVWAEGIDTWAWGCAVTDPTGDYIIELGPGFYTVSAYAGGYEMGVYPEPVEVLVDEITPDIDIILSPYSQEDGTISGRVVDDSTGNPLAGTLVMTFSDCPGNPFFGYAFADENGDYTIENVPVVYCECYYVVAFAIGYIPEFYDNVYTFEEATPVAAFAENVDFSLSGGACGPRGISGRISSGKTGVENALVFAMEGSEMVASAITLPDGSYRMRELPPGVYTVMVTAVGYESTSYPYPVDVTTENVSGINFDLSMGIEDNNDIVSTQFLTVAPNPTRVDPAISFALPKDCEVSLSLHDVTGRVVEELTSGYKHAGVYTESINIENLPGGIYFVRLQAGKTTLAKKVVILR